MLCKDKVLALQWLEVKGRYDKVNKRNRWPAASGSTRWKRVRRVGFFFFWRLPFLSLLLNLLQYCFYFVFYVFLLFWLQGIWYLRSLTRNQSYTPCIEMQSLNHWTVREVLRLYCLEQFSVHSKMSIRYRDFQYAPCPHIHKPSLLSIFPTRSTASVIIREPTLMLSDCGGREDSWESLGQQRGQTSQL